MDLSDEEANRLIVPFRNELEKLMDTHDIDTSRVYNVDQTGLYYTKLPNCMYVNKADQNNFAGTKQMKLKERVTLMVCTAADGSKCPLAMVGKSKLPTCFNELSRGPTKGPPMAYTSQKNAWFHKTIMYWWINHVFWWPDHFSKHGNEKCFLVINNCSVQTKLDMTKIPERIIILYLPPNVTSQAQPADMGIIGTLKVGYKV